MINKLVFTCGDINGIGPEIVVKTFNKIFNPKIVSIIFVCPKSVFNQTIKLTRPTFPYRIFENTKAQNFDSELVNIIDIGRFPQNIGAATASSGRASYLSIKKAFELIKMGIADGLVTAPISKTALKKSGINFPGHTEMLAAWTGEKKFVMLFVSPKLKAGLATIHQPLSNVSKLITKKSLKEKFEVIIKSLERDFGIESPRVAVLGLNPHAGEEGNIGIEEVSIIKPVIKELNINFAGPFVPDAFFANKFYKNFDAVVGMYHDQVLIPFKMLSFHNGVNFTAGLPIIRTSPDHGTAYEIAGRNISDPRSMIQAVKVATTIIRNRKRDSR